MGDISFFTSFPNKCFLEKKKASCFRFWISLPSLILEIIQILLEVHNIGNHEGHKLAIEGVFQK